MAENRYARQVIFSGIGAEGQERLARGRVLLVGCGALGSAVAEILVRAGVGALAIADRDYVDETNLQRQSLFTEQDCRDSLPKAVAAARHLREIDSLARIQECVVDVHSKNIESLLQSRDLILDGTDNFETRYLLNDASLRWKIPWIYGSCVGAYGLAAAFVPGRTPCLRCVLEMMPPPGSSPTCDTAGIIGPIVHAVAAMEAAEALKILAGRLDRLNRRITAIDLWENRVSTLDLAGMPANPDCPACGQGRFEFLSGKHESRGQVLCGRNAVQLWRGEQTDAALEAVAARLASQARVTYNDYLLRAVMDELEIVLFRDGRMIVRGVRDEAEAKRICARYVGL